MTSTAKDNQLDFNVLFVIALPVLIGVWEWLAFAGLRWNSKRKDAPESVGDPAPPQKERRMVVDRDYVRCGVVPRGFRNR